MRVLIVEGKTDLALLWQRHLERQGLVVDRAETADQALDALLRENYTAIVINLVLPGGGAFGVADYARVARPDINVILVSNQSFFHDGSLFALVPNLRMTIDPATRPEDVAAIVSHYAQVA